MKEEKSQNRNYLRNKEKYEEKKMKIPNELMV